MSALPETARHTPPGRSRTLPLARPDVSEARRATHDGYIWPVERARMRDAGCIRIRMADDITAEIRRIGIEHIAITMDWLIRRGWDRAQIDAHFAAAMIGLPHEDEA